jgi:DNA-3-methyladenine glycosylase II
MRELEVVAEVQGPWSLGTSARFWEGFAPAALAAQPEPGTLRATFLSEADWTRAEATVVQDGGSARIRVGGTGDLEAAAAQVARFLSLDVDAREWPEAWRPFRSWVAVHLRALREYRTHEFSA